MTSAAKCEGGEQPAGGSTRFLQQVGGPLLGSGHTAEAPPPILAANQSPGGWMMKSHPSCEVCRSNQRSSFNVVKATRTQL